MGKRRSGRNTKRKKYIDDVEYNFSEAIDENSLLPDGDPYNPSQAGPNYAFIDPTAEDTMIVQYILTSRVGTRELEDSEDESEKPKVENDVKEEAKTETSEAPESDNIEKQ